jgi:peptidoglycan-N-acetylmuramic acid deacetylase
MLTQAAAATAVMREESSPCNWFCVHRHDNMPPPLDNKLRFIENYGAYYLDHSASDDDKVIYLTFDAGYENGNIAKILDILHEHKATSAFFLLDHMIKDETELVIRMADEGHLVCNHTTKHRDMSVVTQKTEFAAELAALEDIYRQYTGREMSKFYRPPEGRFSELNLRHASELGYATIFWSFAYADWDNDSQPDPEAARKKILENTHNGEIILMHPNSATNATILGGLIDEWKAMGYRFGSLEELIHKDEAITKNGDEIRGAQ